MKDTDRTALPCVQVPMGMTANFMAGTNDIVDSSFRGFELAADQKEGCNGAIPAQQIQQFAGQSRTWPIVVCQDDETARFAALAQFANLELLRCVWNYEIKFQQETWQWLRA